MARRRSARRAAVTVALAARADRRQHRARGCRTRPAAPRPTRACRRFISCVRLALVTSVTCRPPFDAARQMPHEEGVDVAEERVAALGQLARARSRGRGSSGSLQAAEVARRAAGRCGSRKNSTPRRARCTRQVFRDARVLPHEGVVDAARPSADPIPPSSRAGW